MITRSVLALRSAWLVGLLAVGLALLVRPAAAVESAVTVKSATTGLELPATLIRPDGPGPFPAIVIAHDCSGLGGRSSGGPRRWATELVARNYVVLMPDSFTPRGLPDGVCIAGSANRAAAAPSIRAADVYGALALLRTLPYVDGARIGLMGGSHGGATTLAALVEPGNADPLAAAKRHGFAAAIALYPSCGNRYGAWAPRRDQGVPGPVTSYGGVYRPLGPLLILTGAEDDWTPAAHCQEMARTSAAAGLPVAITVYPDAHHAFDSTGPHRYVAQRNNQFAPSGRGATTAGNATAWAAAREEVARFFGDRLNQGK